MIYLDYAATQPMRKVALETYKQVAEQIYGNASSLHDLGFQAEHVLEKSREKLADLLGKVDANRIYFTSSGSEANILAVRSILKACPHKKHIVTTKVEHASLYELGRQLEKEGYELTYLPLSQDGILSIEDLAHSIRDETVLVMTHHVNSELGAVQPIEEMGRFLQEKNILFHVDCVQSFGEVPIPVELIDSLSVSGHKIGGPKGCGFVYVRGGVRWLSVYEGATHENGFRPGTVDVPAIAAFSAAAIEAFQGRVKRYEHMKSLRQCLADRLEFLVGVELIKCGHQLPHIAGVLVDGFEGQHILLACNEAGLAISTGSACQVGMQGPSRSIMALGYSEVQARQFVRLSFGEGTRFSDVDEFVDVLRGILTEKKVLKI